MDESVGNRGWRGVQQRRVRIVKRLLLCCHTQPSSAASCAPHEPLNSERGGVGGECSTWWECHTRKRGSGGGGGVRVSTQHHMETSMLMEAVSHVAHQTSAASCTAHGPVCMDRTSRWAAGGCNASVSGTRRACSEWFGVSITWRV
jgi:hypothetical protein